MKISHGTRIKNINPACGYGSATHSVLRSLAELGYEVNQNDKTADVEIWFDAPQFWEWGNTDQYRIGYMPWESTELKPGWKEKMNEVDELWTTSPLIAQWFRDLKLKPPIYVYQHGIDKIWTPKEREYDGELKFLHMGAEAARKGGMEVMRTLRKAFPNRTDVSLTLKMISPGWNIPAFGRTQIINRTLNVPELVEMFHEHHVYAYPSWGEGFGLTPLQAMATGMPTITVPAWAPYAHHLDPDLNLGYQVMQSPWPALHPGKMFSPSMDDLIDRLRYAANNYEKIHEFAQSRADSIRKEYDWNTITADTFASLEERLETSSKTLALESSTW